MKKRWHLPSSILGTAAASFLAACAEPPATPNAPAPSEQDHPQASSSRTADPIDPYVAHKNQGHATFAWLSGKVRLPEGAGPAEAAKATLSALGDAYRMTPATLASARLRSVHEAQPGGFLAQFEQRVDNIEVFHAGLTLALDKNMQPVAATGALARSIRPKSKDFGADARQAIGGAFKEMTGANLTSEAIFVRKEASGYQSYQIGKGEARTKEVWVPQSGGLVPAYYVELDVQLEGQADSRLMAFVTTAAGEVLFRHDLVASDAFTYRVWADKTAPFRPFDSPFADYTPHPTGLADGKAPAPVASNLVTLQNYPFSKNDPWLDAAATETRGNNVWAYADIVAPDGFGMGDVAVPTTAAKTFDRTFDPTTRPQDNLSNRQAITTNLFYILNYMHDYFYDAGWDEKSFNPQEKNFGRGGTEADPIKGEAQDVSGRNNANASTPADGRSPRIQMYLFDNASGNLAITAPMDLAGDKDFAGAAWGPTTYDVTGDLVIAKDMAAMNVSDIDGCDTLTNKAELAGNIALIERGNCNFTQKVLNAQGAGAKAVIITNNQPGLTTTLGGTPPMPITVAAMGMSKEDGDKIRMKLAAGTKVTVKMNAAILPDRDGSLDTSIVSHEWGHVLSNRLIGNASGLFNVQGRGMGEGWSDFVALLVTTRPEDAAKPINANWKGVFPVGSQSLPGKNAWYYGIRRYPYSTDLTKNPLTFKHIQNGIKLPDMPVPAFGLDGASNAEVHNTGEVWSSFLWECYTGILKNNPFDEAEKRMRAYLVGGLKLTPVGPTILQARDAQLAAIWASGNRKDFDTCWAGFAKRGAGVGAVGPASASTDNVGVTESFSVGNDFAYLGATLDDTTGTNVCDKDGILDANEMAKLTISIRNTGAGTLEKTTVTLTSDVPQITFPKGNKVTFPKIDPYAKGSVNVDIAMAKDAMAQLPFKINMEFADPDLAQQRKITASESYVGNYDNVEGSSTTDTVNAIQTPWSVAGDAMLDTSKKWDRVFENGNGRWHIDANPAPSDSYLISPKLQVNGAFSFNFKHRFRFENQIGQFQDGGVLELSEDGGKNWIDIGDKITDGVKYNATIYNTDPAQPLKGRRAFGGATMGFPMTYQQSTVTLGNAYMGKEVLVRFRVGTDEGTGTEGWDIDEIAFAGISNKPFSSPGMQRQKCNSAPTANAGKEQVVMPGGEVILEGSGSDPENDPLTFRWRQVDGQMAGLSDTGTAQLRVKAPETTEQLKLTFGLVVSDGRLESVESTVVVWVDPGLTPPPPQDKGCNCNVGGSSQSSNTGMGLVLSLGAFGYLLRRRRRS